VTHAKVISDVPEEHRAEPVRPVVSVTGPIAASEGIVDVVARPGTPELAAAAEPVGSSVLVDVKVGDINGKPVYASKFLETMGDRLKQKAVELERAGPYAQGTKGRIPWRDAWANFAADEINKRLASMIEDELLRAEAIASFTPEQRKGFFAFMENLGSNLQSENMGSRAAANERLSREKGMTMEDWLRAKEEENLVGFEVNQRIEKRVNVTWRDIKAAYAQIKEDLESGPVGFHRIDVRSDNAAAVEEIKKDLVSGDAFIELAKKPYNSFNAPNAGLEEIKVSGTPEAPQFYANAKLNDAAKGLKPGEWAGPVELSGRYIWLYREDRKLPPLGSDVQLILENRIRDSRKNYEKAKYLERLRAKSTMTSAEAMSRRLQEIAAERYLPPAPASTPTTAPAPTPEPRG